MKFINYFCFFVFQLCVSVLYSQESFPVYQDYLSDNMYLIHPAAAGIGETGKIRVAVRMEAIGVADTPQIQTASFHGKIGDSKAAFGLILLNNKSNILFRQQAIQATYAYHLDLSQSSKFQQLSFALSVSGIQSEIGSQTTFSNSESSISQITQPLFYLSADVGVSYHLNGLSSYFTVKNAYASAKEDSLVAFNDLDTRNYIFGLGYFFGNELKAQYEPSIMVQYKDVTREKVVDVNFKVYKRLKNGQVWAAISYRNSSGGSSFSGAKYISPIIGVNANKMMFSYTYSKQMGEVLFSNGSFHQISIGINILPKDVKPAANPNINSLF